LGHQDDDGGQGHQVDGGRPRLDGAEGRLRRVRKVRLHRNEFLGSMLLILKKIGRKL
jgi:hypothetical protein